MKDIRVSIRLKRDEHIKFKTLAIKRQKSMQELLIEYVYSEIKREEKKDEKNN